MLSLKHKIRRIDSGMSKDEFALFISENVRPYYVNTGKHRGMMDSKGNIKPIYQWEYFLWQDVQQFKAVAYVVRAEYVEEVIGTLCMVGANLSITAPAGTRFGKLMRALGLKPLMTVVYGADDGLRAVSWETISTTNVLPNGTIMALGTDKYWFVYPVNIRYVNRLLRRKEGLHG